MFRNCPALVLNADFQPLSYFPLSLFGWEDTVKAVVKGSHVIVAQYDQMVRSPSTAMRLPPAVIPGIFRVTPSLVTERVCKACACVHARFNSAVTHHLPADLR